MLQTNLCGIKLENPILPGSGPHTGNLDKMLSLANTQKLGALVTKTIAPEAAQVPRPCIVATNNSVMNAELWSEYDCRRWIEDFLPNFKKQSSTPIIASVGYKTEEMCMIMREVDPFVDGYEVNPRYASQVGDFSAVGALVAETRKITERPIWVKMNGAAFSDPIAYARACVENGANGVIAATAIGPNMVIDLKKRRPMIGPTYVWTSGPAIKPYALAMIYMIKNAMPDISILATGGVSSAQDVVEYLLAGADAVEVLSIAMLKGKHYYSKIIEELPGALKEFGFSSVEEVKATTMVIPEAKLEPSFPKFDAVKCRKCGLCSKNCPYDALCENAEKLPVLDKSECFGCGLCESRCPAKAIFGML